MKKLPLMTILLLIAASLLVSDRIRPGRTTSGGTDYTGYWAGVQYVDKLGGGDFYSETGERKINSFYKDPAYGVDSDAVFSLRTRSQLRNVQTPLIYAVIAPITLGNYSLDQGRFGLFSTVFFVGGMLLLLRLFGFDAAYSLTLLIFVLLVFNPFFSDYLNNNFSRFQLGFFALALFSLSLGGKRWSFLAGFILWFGVLIKPSLALVPAFLIFSRIVRRQWGELKIEVAGSLAGIAAGLAIGALYFGYPGVWLDWLSMIKDFSYLNTPFTSYNLSFSSMLNYLTGKDFALPALAAGLLLTGYRIYRLGLLARETDRDGKASFLADLQVASLGLAAYLLCAKLAWLHYFVLVLPLVLLLFSPVWQKREKWWLTAASLAGFLALTTVPMELVPKPPMMVNFALTWGGTLLLFVLGSQRLFTPDEAETGREE
ncbi:DUF2029 domain-containing protein [bacterium]|nr:MAG: DUF2029 domain-containing protein [bacterium]